MRKNQDLLKMIANLIKPLLVLTLFFVWSSMNDIFSQTLDENVKTVASDRGAEDWFGSSVSISGDYAIVSAAFEDEDVAGENTLNDAGAAYIFKNNAGTWSQVQKIVASDRSTNDWFGFGNAVSISGDYAIVGAYLEDEDEMGVNTLADAGSAYIFKNNAGTWSQVQKIVASDRSADDNFGFSVSISEDYAIVGAHRESENEAGEVTLHEAGSAYIFKNNEGTWSQVQKIVASDRSANDWFSTSLSISGDYAIIGAEREDENATGGITISEAGSAYIFKNNAGTWSQVQKIVAPERGIRDRFGFSVSISENYAIVGAYREDEDITEGNYLENAGAAYIFKNNEGTWSQAQKIVAADREDEDNFGWSVSTSGDYAIIGAHNEDHDTTGTNYLNRAGAAYIFKVSEGTWYEAQKVVASDRGADAWFGWSVSISGNHAIVGAVLEDGDATGENHLNNAGSVYILKKRCLASDITTSTSGNTITATNENATYQWLDCDNDFNTIIDETEQTFTPTINGNYAVEITENGCVDTSACVPITTVGIIENSLGEGLKIYPNPTNGFFLVDLGATYKEVQILITDISGKLIESKHITQSRVPNLFINGPAGVYFLTIQAKDKKATLRLIKE